MSGKPENKVSAIDLTYFLKQLSLLLKGGISTPDAISILCENVTDKKQQKLYEAIEDGVGKGYTLSQSIEETKAFPSYMVKMVKIGETSGKLDEVLDSLYLYYERSYKISNGIKNIITYPLIMVLVMLVVIALLIVKALPIFARSFEQVGAELPKYLQRLSTPGGTAVFLIVLCAVVAAAALIFILIKFTPAGKRFAYRLYERSFLTRNIADRSNANKFAFAMSLSLSAGVNLDDAMELASQLSDSEKLTEKTALAKKLSQEGKSLDKALTESGLLSPQYAAMIAVGQRAGRLDEMMETIASRLSDESEEWLDKLISAIEPTIVIIMSLVVGGILLSVMLPLMNIMTVI